MTMEITSGQTVEVQVAGARVIIPTNVVVEYWLDRVRGIDASATPKSATPRIGDNWGDGVYAGMARGGAGEPDYHLIVMPQADSSLKWQAAMDWAAKESSVMPTRRELALCFANVPELFEKCGYWSCEPYAGGGDYAWCAYFGTGYQYHYRKAYELRARAVRRLPIQ